MKPLPLLAATFALTLWGPAQGKERDTYKPPMVVIENEVTQAQMSRLGAPTVYAGEATGAPGRAVITSDGRIWAPEEAPGNTVLRTPTDVERSIARHSDPKHDLEVNGSSEVIDEGPTSGAPQR
ncbi:MAG: hypothetical protein ACXU86_04585, partial [Archangium sp.]